MKKMIVEQIKNELEKSIINELLRKDIIDFYKYNNIIKKINKESQLDKKEESTILTIKVPI